MPNKSYERREKESIPVLAICYDFDKTLSPNDMQAQGFIQAVGYTDPEDFWNKTNSCAEENEMDQNLSWMYQMMLLAEGKVLFTKNKLTEYGSGVKLFPGVDSWFERINHYGEENKVKVEHYVISSGLKEMIEGTSIAGAFEKIYASSFYYNERGVAKWPAQVVNYTNKTQFLFRIEKGVLEINDSGVNDYFPPEDVRVPFRNIVYIGDSDTDVPCMKLVNSLGGHSIGVYNPDGGNKKQVCEMIENHRIKYFVPADYTHNSELELLVRNIILKTVTNELLEDKFVKCKNEAQQILNKSHEEQQKEESKKNKLIYSLMTSPNYAMTHTIIRQLSPIKEWNDDQRELICNATHNPQVGYVLMDEDVHKFYKEIVSGTSATTECIEQVRKSLGLSSISK